jgi:acyl-coenzyme A synthetase/AMP-(fatty) acid ligase
VSPGDGEPVLDHHPAFADVGVAAHTGTATAFVVLAAGTAVSEDELVEFGRARLAAHEVPSSIVFLDRLPRSSVGKLLRHELALLIACD